MKRLLFSAMLVMAFVAASAQSTPNRMLVIDKDGYFKGFGIENIDSIIFASVEGKIAAEMTFSGVTEEADGNYMITLDITKTESCQAFRIGILPTAVAMSIKDGSTADRYLKDYCNEVLYYDDFSGATIRTNATSLGQELVKGGEYSILTVGYDEYNVAGDVERVDFVIPNPDIVGTPNVAWEATEVGSSNINVSFTPNSDVSSYYVCLYGDGEFDTYYEMFAGMFQFANRGDMVKAWGVEMNGNGSREWTDLTPDTWYEIYILPLDANGTQGDLIVARVKTENIGGTGEAIVTIEIGEFGGTAGNYWQEVTYTPNDQCALHRDMIITKEAYETAEWGESGVKEYLMTDNDNDPDWNQYGVDVAKWNASPNTTYIAASIAKNANNEWGPLTTKEFTTPSGTSSKTPAVSLPIRINNGNNKTTSLKGVVPTIQRLKIEN